MQDFEYAAPKSLEKAIALASEPKVRTKVLSGGTDILVQLRAGRFSIDRLIDVKHVLEMNQVSVSSQDGLTLGAAVPCYRIYEDPKVSALYSGLVDAASLIGGIQIQSRASIGGNLCNASPSGDAIPSLIALGAACGIVGPKGQRSVAAEQFCTGPGRNVLESGEMLVALKFPAPKPHSGAHYLRFIPRNEMDIAVAGVASAVVLDESKRRIVSARISLSAVGPTPIYAKTAGDALVGKEPTEAAFEQAAAAAQQAARPIDDMRGTATQRVHLIGVLTKRTLRVAVQRAMEA